MKKIFSLFFCLMFIVLSFPLSSFAESGRVLNVYNWGEYIPDGTDGAIDLNKEFTKQTGIKVNYTTYQSNEEMYTKLSSGGVSYDVVIPSDYMISKMISHDMLAEINYKNIPNYKNIMSEFRSMEYDPNNKHSVPYTWGTVGILYNKKLIKNIDDVNTWDVLWNKDYKGQILMFSNSRDAFACAFSKLGYSLNTIDKKQWREAAQELLKEKPLVQSYAMDQIMDKMIAGEATVAPYYAGDALTCMSENPDIGFIIPDGAVSNRFVDAMCVLKNSTHKEEAEEYINFILKADIGAEVCNYTGYSTPNNEAFKLLDDDLKNSPVAYPDSEKLNNTEVFVNLPADIDELQKDLWTSVRADSTGSVWSIVIVIACFAFVWAGIAFYKRIIKKNKFM